MNVNEFEKNYVKALESDRSFPHPYNTPEREKEVYEQLLQLDFVKERMAEYEESEFCRIYNKYFLPENLQFFYYDDFGRCSVFLSLEDMCAIRNEKGEWRYAGITESEEFGAENLARMQITDCYKPQ